MKSETPQPAAAQPLKEASAVKQIAERIARSAHEGQMEELTGDDYIRHIERVVSLVSGDDAKAVAWLHDVLEDTDVTSAYLIAAGIPDEVRLAVERLTRGDEPYAAYIETIRSSGPMLARVVKVADLRDHLRPNCPERLRQRYEKALAALESEVQPPAAATQEQPPLAKLVGRWPNERLIRSHTCQSSPTEACASCETEAAEQSRIDEARRKLDAIRIDREHREAAVHHGHAAPDLAPAVQPATAEPHPFAVGTEARYQHDIETRDMVISSLTEKLARLQQPAAGTQEREALREMTSALKGFVEWHGGAHVGPCPEDDTCDCQGKSYNDAVNEAVRKADAILKVQPAAAAPQDETLALVNQALTKAGSRHIVGTKDGVIVACTIEEALQPAAAAPPIDMEPIKAREAAATKGPWKMFNGYGPCPDGRHRVERFGNDDGAAVLATEGRSEDIAGLQSDWEFLAHARQDIPILIAEVARLRALRC